ncbi:MAG: glucose-6-phosphate isomerase [Gammaproteobacteria bacterium]
MKISTRAKLEKHAVRLRGRRVDDLFAANPDRFEQFTLMQKGIALDYSRQLLDAEAREALVAYAEEQQLASKSAALFAGDKVNITEGRAALHMALRAQSDDRFALDGDDLMPLVIEQRDRFLAYAEAIREGKITGHTGKPINTVVNIGIGGSHLGPLLATDALAYSSGFDCHFISGAGGQDLDITLHSIDPETTLFIICSKTFTTRETMLNANAAREWFVGQMSEAAIASHFAAVSTNSGAMDKFGISQSARFSIWDWVGGRYSVWSAIGLIIAIAIGRDAFMDMLAGAASMDKHFRSSPWLQNMPVLLALVDFWNRDFLQKNNHLFLPYDRRLHYFPDYIQQLEMESLGKSVRLDGTPVDYQTSPAVWGMNGSNAQHSFMQALHQGTLRSSVDFFAVAKPGPNYSGHNAEGQHDVALASMLAQAEALKSGRQAHEVEGVENAAHRVQKGNVPSNILVLHELSPFSLGSLMALYEHKVFVLGVLWDINPFDQWGVELGKILTNKYEALLAGEISSTGPRNIVTLIREWQED